MIKSQSILTTESIYPKAKESTEPAPKMLWERGSVGLGKLELLVHEEAAPPHQDSQSIEVLGYYS